MFMTKKAKMFWFQIGHSCVPGQSPSVLSQGLVAPLVGLGWKYYCYCYWTVTVGGQFWSVFYTQNKCLTRLTSGSKNSNSHVRSEKFWSEKRTLLDKKTKKISAWVWPQEGGLLPSTWQQFPSRICLLGAARRSYLEEGVHNALNVGQVSVFPRILRCSFKITNHIFHTFNLLNVSLVSMTSGYSFQITDSYSTYMECKQRTQHWSNGIPSISFLFSSHDIDAAFRSPSHKNIWFCMNVNTSKPT